MGQVRTESLTSAYRPKTFREVVGQREAIDHLCGLLSLPLPVTRSFLLVGPSGTGKTTLSRIIAASFNCSNKDDDGNPCTKCSACLEILRSFESRKTEGFFPSLIRHNCAELAGVETIQEILRAVWFATKPGAYRIFILEEVHRLSPAAQAVLLDILEEPPKHVLFILCTTDGEKILDTIRGRCQVVRLQQADPNDITPLLRKISEEEGFPEIAKEDRILSRVAAAGGGSIRVAVQNLEELMAHRRTSKKVVRIF